MPQNLLFTRNRHLEIEGFGPEGAESFPRIDVPMGWFKPLVQFGFRSSSVRADKSDMT